MSAPQVDIEARVATPDLDIRMAVAAGSIVAVVGPNGAGKSSLLRVVAGLLPLDAGRIAIGGVRVDDPTTGCLVPARERGIGMVFQDYLLFPHLSALANVAFALRARGIGRAEAHRRAADLLASLGLSDALSRRPAALSGGEAQRVAVGRALVTDPGLVLLDEPMAALDAHARPGVRALLRKALAGRTALLVTHDGEDVRALCDRVAVLENGRLVQSGTPAAVAAAPATAFAAALLGPRADGGSVGSRA